MERNGDSPVIRMRGIVKSFAGPAVVDGVDLDLFGGQIHVLAGENGAGKSTLMKVLAGIHKPDQGTIEVDGVAREMDVREAKRMGIALVHQELTIAPNLSVADNLAMGREFRNSHGTLDRGATREHARRQLALVGADFTETTRAGKLSTGRQQLVEIARALANKSKVIIFDEPTAALSAREAENLFSIVRGLRAAGTGIVYITHRMEEIDELADSVTVLRDGKLIETMPKSIATPEAIVTRMVGRSIESLFDDDRSSLGGVVLEVSGITDGADIGPIDLSVRSGEVVGIAGLVGSGRSEFARLLFGADRSVAGTVHVKGALVDNSSPQRAMRSGIAMVPESRKEQGLVLGQSVANNMVMASLQVFSRLGVIQRRSVRSAADISRGSLGIKASAGQHVAELSGGNQQKVMLSKWLQTNPVVLILDEPTRGVDVGAKEDIYRIISRAAEDGMGVIVISSELPEVLGLSDRVLVMRKGRIVADLPNSELTEEMVMEHAFGLGTNEDSGTAANKEAAK